MTDRDAHADPLPTAGDPTPTDDGATAGRRVRRRRWVAAMCGVAVVVVAAAALAAGRGSDATGRTGTYAGPATVNGCPIAPNASCPGVDLTGANLAGADLAGADLSAARLTSTILTGANLSGANLTGATFAGGNADSATFRGASMAGATFQDVSAKLADFSGATMADVLMVNSNFQDARFVGARLDRVGMRRVNIATTTMTDATMPDAIFEFVMTDGAVMTRVDLRGAAFRKMSMVGVDLSGADLTRAVFNINEPHVVTNLKMVGADLTGAGLSRLRDLEMEDFTNAVISNTTMPSTRVVNKLVEGDLLYTGLDVVPTVRRAYGTAEIAGTTPQFVFDVTTGGLSLDAEVKVVSGCLAFGTQTKRFTLDGMHYRRADPVYDTSVTWVGPSTLSNMCGLSVYEVRVRPRDAVGPASTWSPPVRFRL